RHCQGGRRKTGARVRGDCAGRKVLLLRCKGDTRRRAGLGERDLRAARNRTHVDGQGTLRGRGVALLTATFFGRRLVVFLETALPPKPEKSPQTRRAHDFSERGPRESICRSSKG